MARELWINTYLRFISLLFAFYRPFPVKRKVVMVVSFAENNIELYKEMKNSLSCETIFITNKKQHSNFVKFNDAITLLFQVQHFVQFLRSIYHLSTAKIVFVDNYYGFLAAARFKKGVKCIQLWHANGAIKKFGLEDQSIRHRGKRARERFQQVYDKFEHVVVGSDAMGEIFQQAFGLDESRILKTGVPRTDVFWNKDYKQEAIRKIKSRYPFLSSKKVILYAPTYRDEQINQYKLSLDLDLFKKELGNDYILLLRLHPAVKSELNLSKDLQDFILDVSNYSSLNELLFITDILITDYSSIPFEFSFLNKPMIFYPYDLNQYKESRGFWEDYQNLVPGPIVFSNEEIISTIKSQDFDYTRIADFNIKWNEFSQGYSCKNIVEFIKVHLSENMQSELIKSSSSQ